MGYHYLIRILSKFVDPQGRPQLRGYYYKLACGVGRKILAPEPSSNRETMADWLASGAAEAEERESA